MRFNEEELLAVAKAVVRLNPYARGLEPEYVVARMKEYARSDLADHKGYVATFGFVLCNYDHPSGGVGVKAALDALLLEDLA